MVETSPAGRSDTEAAFGASNPKAAISNTRSFTEAEFKRRTKDVALRVIRLVEAMPRGRSGDAIARQLVRSGTSVGANYRAAVRARSSRDMIAKLAIVEEEADETLFWLEWLSESGLVSESRLVDLHKEVEEILSMTVASIRTLRRRRDARQPSNPKSTIPNPKSTV